MGRAMQDDVKVENATRDLFDALSKAQSEFIVKSKLTNEQLQIAHWTALANFMASFISFKGRANGYNEEQIKELMTDFVSDVAQAVMAQQSASKASNERA